MFKQSTISDKKTQRAAILSLLIARRGEWVPVYQIAEIALQYNSRILELRRQGFYIICKKMRAENSQIHSWYKLETAQEMVGV